jgi:DNA-binding SARP family transcriptional activator
MHGGGVGVRRVERGLFLHVLGPLSVRRDGSPIALGGRLPRNLLLVLAAANGRTVAVARLVDELWGDDAPDTAEGTVASYVSRLRKLLDEDGTPAAESVIRRQAGGYNLVLPPGRRDDEAFRDALDAGRRALRSGRPVEAIGLLEEALDWWTDDLPPLEELPPGVRPEAMRLAEERTEAVEVRADALVQIGRHDEAIRALDTFVTEHPLR